MSAKHSVFVLGVDGKPLTPTIPSKARKLLRTGVARKVWSKFNTFGIQMLVETRHQTPQTSLGVDTGSSYEGYAVVCDKENSLAIKLDLPDKQKVVKKLEERRRLRRARRHRRCRRRPARFDNRRRRGFIAPSQAVIVGSRLKVMRELFRLYPIDTVGLEDVRFNHAAKRWGANFSTAEIGKTRLREFVAAKDVLLFEYQGFETKGLRERCGYAKTRDKCADIFTSHCSDALALACEVGCGLPVEPGRFIVVDDTYRPVKRRLHDTQFSRGGIRQAYSRGTVFGLRKGLLVGTSNGKLGCLCGETNRMFRYYDDNGKRQVAKRLVWISSNFVIKEGGGNSPVA